MIGGRLRAMAGTLRSRLQPKPERIALRRFVREARRVPRHTSGRLRLMDLDLEYVDALSTVPQWDDLFVRRSLAFTPATETPRVLDCGANIGLTSLWIKRAFPGARVTAFEADPTVAAVLARNLAANGCGDVEVVPAAVWSSAGRLRFRVQGADAGALEDVEAAGDGPSIEVEAVRLRDWVTAGPVDLLKLDVEGAELDVLRDLADVLSHVRALQVEVHDLDARQRRLPACLDLLHRHGFDYTLDDLHPVTWRTGMPSAGPFPGVAAWVVLVRAWPRRP